MQKKLIALAVASLASGAAFAQTNVTMYGVADVGYMYSTGDAGRVGNVPIPGTNTFSGIQSGLLAGSRLGFRGEETLGNGLKAVFTLEYALNLDNNSGVGNTGGLNARQQYVGLSHAGWGTIALGRQYAPGYLATVNNDPFGGAIFEPQSFLTTQAGNSITPNTLARWDNAITYTSPNWGGFTGKAIYSFGETSAAGGTFNDKLTDVSDNGKWGLGANFATGPFNLDVVYHQRQSVTNGSLISVPGLTGLFTANGKAVEEAYIGGSFDLKFVKLMASWQGQNDKNAANLDNQFWQIGAVIPVLGSSNIHLGYSELYWDQGSQWVRGVKVKRPLNDDSQAAALGWTTALSKRTTLYAGYVWVKNDKRSYAAGPVAGVGARGEDNNTFLAGINHKF
ncbi:MAG: porin [Candidatus Accumulibacter sp.]|uniref:Porin n=2 Tax=Candidatus Accumulibacter TaxID=327159 RepID=A0A7D5NCD6_9PROT|nr:MULTISPECIES: porin [Candidatus Accumulibacter]MBN8517515.1 porin [Accumulibacter sp.]MBO3711648.1 porin [Accumulibacter sp.]QLH50313.1 MAG: porin [Candidatus Accumulibacter cognatus]TMQ76883.1 Outer membrane protein assembly factor YaeT precursor [Candidatus Accumulibacter phosphatis]